MLCHEIGSQLSACCHPSADDARTFPLFRSPCLCFCSPLISPLYVLRHPHCCTLSGFPETHDPPPRLSPCFACTSRPPTPTFLTQKKRGLRKRGDFHDIRPEVWVDGLVVTWRWRVVRCGVQQRGVVLCPGCEESAAPALIWLSLVSSRQSIASHGLSHLISSRKRPLDLGVSKRTGWKPERAQTAKRLYIQYVRASMCSVLSAKPI